MMQHGPYPLEIIPIVWKCESLPLIDLVECLLHIPAGSSSIRSKHSASSARALLEHSDEDLLT